MPKQFQEFICPKCRERMRLEAKALVCPNNHSFDLAKEGYVNLLLANQKNSLKPGDTREMIVARDNFLKTGLYDFLVENILQSDLVKKRQFSNLLEVGCGSGFYLYRFNDELQPGLAVGSDVSKEAVKFAAKKYPKIDFAVINSYNLNFQDAFFDLIISIFSPFASEEIERVLAQSGLLVLVRPGKNHLTELYELLEMPKKEKTYPDFTKLKLVENQEFKKKTAISKEDLDLLIKMSPLFWKTQQVDLETLNLKEITFDFLVNVYERV